MKARFVLFFLRLSSWLPLRTSRAVGRGLGRLLWLSGSSARHVTERNVAIAFPELDAERRERLARQSLCATGELAAEMGFVWHRPWSEVRATIHEVRGEGPILEALDRGRGVVLLGPHLGNWEVAGLYIAAWGDALALYEPPHLKAVEGIVRRARERSGTRLVPTDARGLATLVRTLRRGGVTGILPDQVPPVIEAGRNSHFMGVPAFTMTFASKLLQRSGAAAFFGFAQRTRRGYRMQFLPADEAIYSDDIDASLSALNEGVERCLRLCPEQYQWEYKRFRTRPRGDLDPYDRGVSLENVIRSLEGEAR